jgi:TonB family protein
MSCKKALLTLITLTMLASKSWATAVEQFNSPPKGNIATEEVITFDKEKTVTKETLLNYKKIIPAGRVEINEEDYPILSRRLGEEGSVSYSVLIRSNGSVAEVKIIKSPYPRLSDAVKQGAQKWKFRPIKLSNDTDVIVGNFITTFSLVKKSAMK